MPETTEILPEDWNVIKKYLNQYGKDGFFKMYDKMRVKDSIMDFLTQYPNLSFSVTELKKKVKMNNVNHKTLVDILFELTTERKIENTLIKNELYIIYKPR